jgi:hypothetical protein
MKKRNLLLVAILMLSFFIVDAQNAEQGDMILNFGFGFGNNYTAGGDDFSVTIPPISASFEYIIKDNLFNNGEGAIGIGAFAQYMNYDYEITSNPGVDVVGGTVSTSVLKSAMANPNVNDWKYNKFIFGPRGYFHYSFLEKLDTYTGLMLGLDYVGWGTNSTSYSNTDFIWSWFIGGRYYFNDNLAGMLELGYGATYVNIGIAYKF